jgi:hypothetical protein
MCVETRLAFLVSCMLFSLSAVVGCKTSTAVPLPQPATNQELSGAENKLDHLTDKRISRVAAAVGVASETAESLPDSNEKTVIKGELGVAKAMVGQPSPEDFAYAKKRASEYSQENYIKEVATSEALRKAINEANSKYEQEKAKKQAEYESKIAEKELEIKSRKQELEQERIARKQEMEQERLHHNNERILLAGGAAIALGLLLSIFAPIGKLKQLGMVLVGFGTVAAMIPFIADETWFKYAIGGSLGIIVLSGIISFIISNKRNKVDNCTKSVDDTSPPTSD